MIAAARGSSAISIGALLLALATGGQEAPRRRLPQFVRSQAPLGTFEPSFPALESGLGIPRALAVDGQGHLYVGAEATSRIFRLDGERLRIAAGSDLRSRPAYWARGTEPGPAIWAYFSAPTALAFDTTGNLYVADRLDGVVRRIDASTSEVSTSAGILPTTFGSVGISAPLPTGDGVAATESGLIGPNGLALDVAGNLYVAETGAHRIRRVDARTRLIETLAGDGIPGERGDGGPARAARLSSPMGLAIDTRGHLYVADAGNHRVRRITLATGVIATVAGTGVAGVTDANPGTQARLTRPTHVALDGSGGLIIVEDRSSRLRRLHLDSGGLETLQTRGLSRVGAVAAGNDRRLYVADEATRRVFVREPDGSLRTIAGNGGAGYCGDGPGPHAWLDGARAFALDGRGSLFFVVPQQHRVRRVDLSTGMVTTVAGTGLSGYAGDGGPGSRAELREPWDLAIDRLGGLLIADRGNNRIRRLSADGVIATVAGTGRTEVPRDATDAMLADLHDPRAIAVDDLGNIYVAAEYHSNGFVVRIAADSRTTTVVAGKGSPRRGSARIPSGAAATSGWLNIVTALAASDDGSLYIAESKRPVVRRLARGSDILETVAGNAYRGLIGDMGPALELSLGSDLSLSLAPDGHRLYAGDPLNARIWELDLTARELRTAVAGAKPAVLGASSLAEPPAGTGVAIDRDGTLYVLTRTGLLYRIGPAGPPILVAGGGDGF